MPKCCSKRKNESAYLASIRSLTSDQSLNLIPSMVTQKPWGLYGAVQDRAKFYLPDKQIQQIDVQDQAKHTCSHTHLSTACTGALTLPSRPTLYWPTCPFLFVYKPTIITFILTQKTIEELPSFQLCQYQYEYKI